MSKDNTSESKSKKVKEAGKEAFDQLQTGYAKAMKTFAQGIVDASDEYLDRVNKDEEREKGSSVAKAPVNMMVGMMKSMEGFSRSLAEIADANASAIKTMIDEGMEADSTKEDSGGAVPDAPASPS